MTPFSPSEPLAGQAFIESRVQVPLDALLPLTREPREPIWFSDLQAALGLDKYDCQMANRLLGLAGLIDRFAVNQLSKPTYRLTDTALGLLRSSTRQTKAISSAQIETALAIAGAHNAKPGRLRVASAGVTVGMMDSPQTVLSLRLLVKPEEGLAADLEQFIQTLAPLRDAMRVSLVLARR
jgi:hypothetical protein